MQKTDDNITSYGFNIINQSCSFMGLLKKHWLGLFLGSLLLLCTNIVMVILPTLINGGINFLDKGQSLILWSLYKYPLEIKSMEAIILLIVILALLASILRTLSRMVLFNIGRLIERDVRAKLFFHITVLDEPFFTKTSLGEIINHLTTDISNMRLVVGFALLNIINVIFILALNIPFLLKISAWLTSLVLVFFPLIILIIAIISKTMFKLNVTYQEKLGDLLNHTQENLSGAQVVRLFHKQEYEEARFKVVNEESYLAGLKLARIRVLLQPLMRLLIALSVSLILYFGGKYVISGRISLGDFVEINVRILQLAWPAMLLGLIISVINRGKASLNRINNILSYLPSIYDGNKAINHAHKLDVHELMLAKDKTPISFSLAKGQILGIVGQTGSFKTTLIKMLSRRIPLPLGKIFFDGHDLNSLTLTSLGKIMSVVASEPFLFNESISYNLSFENPHAHQDEINKIINLIRLNKDIKNFSHGLNTQIGEKGCTLSRGQKQKLALGRALLAKRPLLILDDALCAVDQETEQAIMREIINYVHDRMIIIISHRLAIMRYTTSIIVLDQGSILEQGNHEILMLAKGLYHDLVCMSKT